MIWFENFFEKKKYFHQFLFSKIPISVGDCLYILLLVILIYFIFKFLKKENRNKFFIQLSIILSIFYFLYQISWGMLYFQTPLEKKIPKKEPSIKEIEFLALKYLKLCIKSRKNVHEDKNGIFEIKNLEYLKSDIIKNQQHIPAVFSNKSLTKINDFKPSLFGKLMNYTGISGYYNPFSAEAQYNPYLPSTYLPFTLSHESAHQLGFAREQEANFIAFLIAENSKNPDLVYSKNLYVLKSLLHYLSNNDPEFVGQIKLFFSTSMKRDIDNEIIFIENHKGVIDSFFHITNDLFLKSNQQEGSITYSYFIDLLIDYEFKKI